MRARDLDFPGRLQKPRPENRTGRRDSVTSLVLLVTPGLAHFQLRLLNCARDSFYPFIPTNVDEEEVAAVVCARLVFGGDERSHSGQQPEPEKHCVDGETLFDVLKQSRKPFTIEAGAHAAVRIDKLFALF